MAAVATALFGAIVWGVQLEARLGEVDRDQAATAARLEVYRETFSRRLERLEDRVNAPGPR